MCLYTIPGLLLFHLNLFNDSNHLSTVQIFSMLYRQNGGSQNGHIFLNIEEFSNTRFFRFLVFEVV